MKIQYALSNADIAEVTSLLNAFLDGISLVTLSRREIGLANPQRICGNARDSKYAGIDKVINRWGIKSKDGKYHARLNEIVGRITACNRMLLIYEPIQFLLFNKLLEGPGATFSQEEIGAFFLQPYDMIVSEPLVVSGLQLHNLIIKVTRLSPLLCSNNAKEFLSEGVGRRLFMLKASVDSISAIYSTNRTEPLDQSERAILSQSTNFFYANIFAIVDCLSFVFAYEDPAYPLDRGKKADFRKVGLFNEEFRARITALSTWSDLPKAKVWYDTIVDLRHPVAHRIPLYFPEIDAESDARERRQIEEDHHSSLAAIWSDRALPPEEALRKHEMLQEEYEKKTAMINVFSGCFLHSHKESKKCYHLSRLNLDLGILYYLIDTSLGYLEESRTGVSKP